MEPTAFGRAQFHRVQLPVDLGVRGDHSIEVLAPPCVVGLLAQVLRAELVLLGLPSGGVGRAEAVEEVVAAGEQVCCDLPGLFCEPPEHPPDRLRGGGRGAPLFARRRAAELRDHVT